MGNLLDGKGLRNLKSQRIQHMHEEHVSVKIMKRNLILTDGEEYFYYNGEYLIGNWRVILERRAQ